MVSKSIDQSDSGVGVVEERDVAQWVWTLCIIGLSAWLLATTLYWYGE